MSPASPVCAPSLSQILGWDTAHLDQAATDWVNTAEHWEGSFTSAHRDTLSPGGISWQGQAAEAAQQRAMADLIQVGGLADILHEASQIVRRGADQLDYLKRPPSTPSIKRAKRDSA